MKITQQACNKNDLTFIEGCILAAIGGGTDKHYKSLIKKGLITSANCSYFELNKKYTISNKGMDLLETLASDSEEAVVAKESDLDALAVQLRDIYPEGKMPGTSYYYKCNKADIVRKLKSFIRKYGDYTTDQILDATKRYVESFNGNYTYMRLLKYFIWKSEVKDGETVVISQLADWIENSNQVNSYNSDWAVSLV